MKYSLLYSVCAVLFLSMPGFIFSEESADHSMAALALEPQDRILILAPHPDDDAIGTGGIIQQAVKMKIPVKVAYLTCGDHNEVSFFVFEKHPVLSQKGIIKMGELRRGEAAKAMEFAGLKADQLVFLGYPDSGTLNIFKRYWESKKPYQSRLTRLERVPYKECQSYFASYTAENILSDLKKVLQDFKPRKIFVSLPADGNEDHRALYLFLNVALWDLEGIIRAPDIYCYLVHYPHWPKKKGYHSALKLDPPRGIPPEEIDWFTFDLTDEQVKKKHEIISFYRSQIEYNPPFLYSFARKNELFGVFPEIVLPEVQYGEVNWESPVRASVKGLSINEKKKGDRNIESLAYAVKDDSLFVKIRLQKFMSKARGLDLYLFGYKKKRLFSTMPKIRLHTGWEKKMLVYDQQQKIEVKEASFKITERDIVIQFPLKKLGDPDYIFSNARTKAGDIPVDQTAWRILKLLREDVREKEGK